MQKGGKRILATIRRTNSAHCMYPKLLQNSKCGNLSVLISGSYHISGDWQQCHVTHVLTLLASDGNPRSNHALNMVLKVSEVLTPKKETLSITNPPNRAGRRDKKLEQASIQMHKFQRWNEMKT